MKLKQYLDQRLHSDRREFSAGLYTRMGEGSFYRYVLQKMTRPLVNTLYQTVAALIFWNWISHSFPLFSWSDILGTIQLIFIYQVFINSLLESIRGLFRRIDLKNSQHLNDLKSAIYPVGLILGTLPFLYFTSRTLYHLSFKDRYFGIYDAIVLVLSIRFLLGLIPKMIQATLAPAKRIPLFWYNWVIGPLILLVVGALTLQSYKTWGLPITLLVEACVSFSLQILRLNQVFKNIIWFHRPKLKLNLILELIKSALLRSPSAFPPMLYHFWVGYAMLHGEFTTQESIFLHVLGGLILLLIRSPWIFWKELWDLLQNPSIYLKFEIPLIITSFIGSLSSILFLSDSTIGDCISLIFSLPWIQLRLIKIAFHGRLEKESFDAWAIFALIVLTLFKWLPGETFLAVPFLASISFFYRRTLVRKKWSIQDGFNTRLEFKRAFWKDEHRVPAFEELTEKGIPFQVAGKSVLLKVLEKPPATWLTWGRGWVVKAQTHSLNSIPSKTPLYEFNLINLSWKDSIPHLPGDPTYFFIKTLLHLQTSSTGFGKVRIQSGTLHWERWGSSVFFYPPST